MSSYWDYVLITWLLLSFPSFDRVVTFFSVFFVWAVSFLSFDSMFNGFFQMLIVWSLLSCFGCVITVFPVILSYDFFVSLLSLNISYNWVTCVVLCYVSQYSRNSSFQQNDEVHWVMWKMGLIKFCVNIVVIVKGERYKKARRIFM